MKFKSYIMPIVLLVFSLVMIFFLSIYHRTISSYNKNNSKEKLVINKFKNISMEDILSTKATLNFINNKINNRENFSINIKLDELLKVNNINDIDNFFENYHITLNSNKIKKKLNFYDNQKTSPPYYLRQYEIFFEVRFDNQLVEYRIVDLNRIENYLFDTQIKNYIEGRKKNLNDNYYIALNSNTSKLYERIFSNEIQYNFIKDLRIYNYNDKIYMIYDEQYKKLLNSYFSSKGFEMINLDINLSDIEDFIKNNNLKNCSKNNFIESYLLENSEYIKNSINIDIKNKLYLDFDKNVEIYCNIKLDQNDEIVVTNKVPKVYGILVNNTKINDIKIDFEGVLFSKNKLNSKYKFSPEILDITARFIKISNNFYLEKIDNNDVK